MSQAQDLMSWLESAWKAKTQGREAGAEIADFINCCRETLQHTPVVGLTPAAMGMALQMADGSIVFLTPQPVHDSTPESSGSYGVIGNMPERRTGIPERPSEKPIFGK